RAVVHPGVGVEQEDVATGRVRDARVPTEREPAVLLLDDGDLGKAVAHERDRAVGRAVIDDDRLVALHTLERALHPRHCVVRHHDDGDVVHRARRASTATIPAPGSAIATTKKRNPVANAGSAATPSAPRNETKNDSRTARPLTVKGTSATRKSSGPMT